VTARPRMASRRRLPPPEDAEFMPRVLAWLIDLAGISFGLLAIGQFVGPGYNILFNGLGLQTDSPIVLVWRVLAIGAVELGMILAVEVAFLRTIGATPGQRLVGLRTVASESELSLPWPRAVGRAALLFGPWIAVLVVPATLGVQLDVMDEAGKYAWVDVLPALLRVVAVGWYLVLALSVVRAPDGRGFHDLASRSVVVQQNAPRG
jgi:uncharacterized RDD family membrane protein YckC